MDIQRLQSLKILVIGDYCEDIFKYGNCTRLSPEAPVPVFLFSHQCRTKGMAGNVYNNLLSFNINCELLTSNTNNVKERYIDLKTKQHLLRADYEKQSDEIILDCSMLKKFDGIIISDYDKGAITKSVVSKIINYYSGFIFIDSKKKDLKIFDNKNCFIKINEEEYKNCIYMPQKARLIVTLGENGVMFNNVVYPTKKVDVFDVSGAGDTFISSFAVQLLLNKSIEDALKFANICASSVVKKSGTVAVDFEEIKNDIRF